MTEVYEAVTIHEGLAFGEAPRWHDGRLWFSDFYRHGVFSIAPDGSGERREVTVEAQPSGLGWLPDGSLLVVSMTDHKVLRCEGESTSEYADISEYCGFWANDMVVSASGVAYVGNFGFDLDVTLRDVGVEGMLASPPPATHLVVLAPGGSVAQVIDGMEFPNGSVITDDGRTLIVAETMPFRLTAFDIATDGTLSGQATFADVEAPDGFAVDQAGNLYVAAYPAGQGAIVVLTSAAKALGSIPLGQQPTNCGFGGADGKTLYVTARTALYRVAVPIPGF